MSSIRSRLAVGYAVTLLLTLGGSAPRCITSCASRASPASTRSWRASATWRSVPQRVISRARRPGPPGARRPRPGVAAGFQGLRDYLLIVDTTGSILYTSDSLAALPFADLQTFTGLLQPPTASNRSVSLRLQSGRDVRATIAPLRTAGTSISAVLLAAPVDRSAPDASVFLRSMLLVAPFVLLASVFAGYWLSANALRPVQGIIDELEAITDGRSLHRRLEVPLAGDEVSRLAQTLNGMLARLEQSFSSLRRFTADASHELKTPLMVLRAGVERSLTDPRTPTELIESLDETLGEINRMTELVEGLLTLARADEGRAPLPVERTDLRDLVAEASETAGMLAESGHHKVTTVMPKEPVWVMVDRRRIREMLLNLVTNAIKYTPAEGKVELSLTTRTDGAAIIVRDTGIGIASNDLPHIFERFWRADLARSRTGERPGSGLGLAITKWIAEAHGGTITASSRPGRGTTLTVVLPVAESQNEPKPLVS
jgi:signal transduction histidine kinase